jgi:ABC-type sugar transport system substrate-binding protein
MSMGFDVTQLYYAGLKAQADKMGYGLIVRDPNWSVELQVQAIQQLIGEKPDIIIAHPADVQALNRLVKKAQDAGIYWIWANIKGGPNGDVYIGSDAYTVDATKVGIAAKYCADRPSKKIAFIGGPSNTQAIVAGAAGFRDALLKHPDLQLVSSQSAEADSNKAKAIAATVLKQHPDLCAIIGQWDGEDVGIPPAVAEAGLKGKVAVITSGAGLKSAACDKVADGSYTAYVSLEMAAQTVALNTAIAQLLQTKPKPGSTSYAFYADLPVITADNLSKIRCATVEEATYKTH